MSAFTSVLGQVCVCQCAFASVHLPVCICQCAFGGVSLAVRPYHGIVATEPKEAICDD
jgi:hypothetical protein